ncbi:phage head closure protein [Priestia aryabhattai]|uniref:phage head closure protein n=1 Tax=Priestia aryabhattai TaxID=412384 RepID=UPI00203BA0F7|nr:phage head closure protein [Priestia aryabhattai]MCM3774031.1 phage head closure protein [Priestia aryabhattai]
MFSGYLDKRVTVTKTQKVFDGRGGWTNKPVSLGQFWAAIEPLGISEIAQYSAMDISVTTQIHMRYNTSITQGCVIEFRGRKYEVQGVVNPAYQDEYMELIVVETGKPVENTPALVTESEKVTFAGKATGDGDETRKIYFGVTYD